MKRLLLGVLLLGSLTSPAGAQLPVMETGPMTLAHTTTALQTTLTTFEAVFQSAQWVLDLTGFEATGLGSGFWDDVMEFQGLLSETEMLLWDLRSLETQLAALYHLERAPDNTRALRDRLLAIRRARQERLTQAQRLQTLQRTALRIADRIMSLADRILDILGDRQGLQNLQGQLATISHTETQTGTLIAAYQQVMLDDPQEQLLIDESMDRINTTLLATLPGRRP